MQIKIGSSQLGTMPRFSVTGCIAAAVNEKNMGFLALLISETLAITESGELYMWGKNFSGQLGRSLTLIAHQRLAKVKIEGY
ncbi:putative regulator of chromosome condensation 1/beta-lactamase-inhibitor protein II [Helianthus annuus]|nr:putative regulator of chromosome condensation 1/beta-lactamase-inhibitor protein II [Helianthus annuus]